MSKNDFDWLNYITEIQAIAQNGLNYSNNDFDKERSDELWTLPGGWAETNESASESVIREAKEETGFDVSVIRLLAFWDKQKHDHPLQWPHTYKCFFHCEIMSGVAKENLEISEIDFFDLAHLPPLSTPRVTQKQITRLYELVSSSDKTLFD